MIIKFFSFSLQRAPFVLVIFDDGDDLVDAEDDDNGKTATMVMTMTTIGSGDNVTLNF